MLESTYHYEICLETHTHISLLHSLDQVVEAQGMEQDLG